MTLILDPNNTADDVAFAGIQDLAETSSTPAEINANPLFVAAESYIVAEIPSAMLPGGRTQQNRPLIVAALQFLTTSYFLSGGGETASRSTDRDETVVGEINSITRRMDDAEITTNYRSGTTHTVSHGSLESQTIGDRSAWYKERADENIALAKGETSSSGIGGDNGTLSPSRITPGLLP